MTADVAFTIGLLAGALVAGLVAYRIVVGARADARRDRRSAVLLAGSLEAREVQLSNQSEILRRVRRELALERRNHLVTSFRLMAARKALNVEPLTDEECDRLLTQLREEKP